MIKHKLAMFITILTLPLAFISSAPAATANPCVSAIQAGWANRPSYIPEMIKISYRESRWQENAYNYYQDGCTQINFGKNGSVHGKWLLAHGITEPMLRKANVNIYVARVLFEAACHRGNCLSPWKATA